MVSIVRRLRLELSARGPIGFVRFLGTRLIRRRADLLFEWKSGQSPLVARDDDLSAKRIDRSNIDTPDLLHILDQVLVGHNSEYRPGLYKRDQLFVALDGSGRVVNYAFVLFETSYKRVLGIGDDVPLISNCYTDPECRGRRLYPKMLRLVCDDLARAGYPKVMISVEPDNVPSIKGINRAGFRGVSYVHCLMIFSRLILGRREVPYHVWQAAGHASPPHS